MMSGLLLLLIVLFYIDDDDKGCLIFVLWFLFFISLFTDNHELKFEGHFNKEGNQIHIDKVRSDNMGDLPTSQTLFVLEVEDE